MTYHMEVNTTIVNKNECSYFDCDKTFDCFLLLLPFGATMQHAT